MTERDSDGPRGGRPVRGGEEPAEPTNDRGEHVIRVRIPGSASGPRVTSEVSGYGLAPGARKHPLSRTISGFPQAPARLQEPPSRPMVKVLGVPVFTAPPVPEAQFTPVEPPPATLRGFPSAAPPALAPPEERSPAVSTALVLPLNDAPLAQPSTALVVANRGFTPDPPAQPGGAALALLPHEAAAQTREERWLPVQILQHYPDLPDAADVPLLNAADTSAAEDYRVLSQRLHAVAPTTKVLALVAVSEVGLTSEIAINLALALAEDRPEPVLIVDANFGNPMLSKVLRVRPLECFARQMRALQTLPGQEKFWVASSVGFEHVHVLSIDPESPAAMRRFDPPAFRSALAALKQAAYRLVIVDLPPALRSSGFNLAGDLVDGVLLAALAGSTRAKHLKLAAERLAPVPVLGTVLFS